MVHLVLLGNSIFGNGIYVADEPCLNDATGGKQANEIPVSASHLFVLEEHDFEKEGCRQYPIGRILSGSPPQAWGQLFHFPQFQWVLTSSTPSMSTSCREGSPKLRAQKPRSEFVE